jgi:hypothetical protein
MQARRVLGHVTVYPGPVVMVSVGRRKWRAKQAVPAIWQPVAEGVPLRVRCRKGHPWESTRDDLLAAYQVAVAEDRHDLVLSVDLCRP